MCLIEKTGADAEPLWDTLLTPLEKAYEQSSGRGFENRFGRPYRPATAGAGGDAVAMREGLAAGAYVLKPSLTVRATCCSWRGRGCHWHSGLAAWLAAAVHACCLGAALLWQL